MDSPTSADKDAVKQALAGAQRISRSRSVRPARRVRDENLRGRARGGFSGPAPDDTDPQPIGGLFAGYVADRDWQRPLAEATVFADWAGLVGPEVASHSRPESLRDGELRLSAESTAWATQLRLLAATLLARLARELGPDVVRKLIISGPAGPSWKHGGYSVRGARGPRDTYG
ncbi:MAG: DUF721 domain-containing protein [Jatrophihabitantaceae bacterium]